MSHSTKIGGQSNKKNRESCESTSEKKLVQARLPFKVLVDRPSTSTELKAAASLTITEMENDTILTDASKRRLSFESDIEVYGTTSNHEHNLSKENVNMGSTSKRSKTLIIKSEEVLPIEGSQENLSLISNKKSVPIRTPKGHSSKKRVNVTTPQSVKVQMGKSNSSPKLQIKLLLSGGKKSKKRKLKTRLEGSSKSEANDEIEVVSGLNPSKKAKIDMEEDTFLKTETELKEEVIELDSEYEDLNKDKEDSENVEADDERDDADVSQNGKVLICVNEEKAKVESLNSVAVLEDFVGISTNIINKNKGLTTKQKRLVEQRRKAREEKERKLQDAKRRKQEEKDEKEQKKRKEREEKEEQKRKERDEKEQRRLADLNAKNEEKRKRNEAKEEELRKKEEERKRKEQEKEEAELKKKKAAEAFTKFFLPKAAISNPGTSLTYSDNNIVEILAFQPFEIKGDMKLAPVFRKILTTESREKLDSLQRTKEFLSEDRLYLATLRSGEVLPSKWIREPVETDDDFIIVEDELDKVGEAIIEEGVMHGRERMRAKFYKFHDNRRPPYYGTWRKKSTVVKPRRPFAEDKKIFDYEADSDDEWEEEEPGESLDGSEDEKDRESEDDDYEVDNKWFVPHGHLSEEEMQNEDEWMADDDNTRQAQKFKLQLLQQEFSQQMKKKTEKIKPRLIGCVWVDENGNQPENCVKIIWDSLQVRTMLCSEPIVIEAQQSEIERSEPLSPMAVTVEKLKPISLSEEMVKSLARLIHGNKHSKNFLINEYIAYVERTEEAVKNGDVRKPLKSMVRDKIDEIAVWKAMETIESTQDSVSANNNNSYKKNKKKKIKKKLCWVVAQAVLDKMGLQHLDLKNGWNYTLVPKLKNTHGTETITQLNESTFLQDGNNEDGQARHGKHQPVQVKLKDHSLKRNVAEKMKQQSTEKKKMPLLMATPREQKISTAAKNNSISQFLQKPTNPKPSNKLNTMLTSDSLDKSAKMVVLD
ncbi:chromatin assembly factor 1 subunit A [Glossina fuscipes]|uniref:Chromatin assembly factor 1 subunit A n=1 Tax=Glossina fuscipes TaxID=7396 RepID=A0A9C6DRZ2_9MUSC|nr:chromatin assembly factor 1 subunit A [Glossina fuscipes]